MIQIQKISIIPGFHLSRQVFLLLFPPIRQGMHLAASLENSKLPRVFEFLFSLASGFPEAVSFIGSFDAIGPFEDEELAEKVEDKFIAIGFDFATIIDSSFCSCVLFASVLVQIIKLEFLAQLVELT